MANQTQQNFEESLKKEYLETIRKNIPSLSKLSDDELMKLDVFNISQYVDNPFERLQFVYANTIYKGIMSNNKNILSKMGVLTPEEYEQLKKRQLVASQFAKKGIINKLYNHILSGITLGFLGNTPDPQMMAETGDWFYKEIKIPLLSGLAKLATPYGLSVAGLAEFLGMLGGIEIAGSLIGLTKIPTLASKALTGLGVLERLEPILGTKLSQGFVNLTSRYFKESLLLAPFLAGERIKEERWTGEEPSVGTMIAENFKELASGRPFILAPIFMAGGKVLGLGLRGLSKAWGRFSKTRESIDIANRILTELGERPIPFRKYLFDKEARIFVNEINKNLDDMINRFKDLKFEPIVDDKTASTFMNQIRRISLYAEKIKDLDATSILAKLEVLKGVTEKVPQLREFFEKQGLKIKDLDFSIFKRLLNTQDDISLVVNNLFTNFKHFKNLSEFNPEIISIVQKAIATMEEIENLKYQMTSLVFGQYGKELPKKFFQLFEPIIRQIEGIQFTPETFSRLPMEEKIRIFDEMMINFPEIIQNLIPYLPRLTNLMEKHLNSLANLRRIFDEELIPAIQKIDPNILRVLATERRLENIINPEGVKRTLNEVEKITKNKLTEKLSLSQEDNLKNWIKNEFLPKFGEAIDLKESDVWKEYGEPTYRVVSAVGIDNFQKYFRDGNLTISEIPKIAQRIEELHRDPLGTDLLKYIYENKYFTKTDFNIINNKVYDALRKSKKQILLKYVFAYLPSSDWEKQLVEITRLSEGNMSAIFFANELVKANLENRIGEFIEQSLPLISSRLKKIYPFPGEIKTIDDLAKILDNIQNEAISLRIRNIYENAGVNLTAPKEELVKQLEELKAQQFAIEQDNVLDTILKSVPKPEEEEINKIASKLAETNWNKSELKVIIPRLIFRISIEKDLQKGFEAFFKENPKFKDLGEIITPDFVKQIMLEASKKKDFSKAIEHFDNLERIQKLQNDFWNLPLLSKFKKILDSMRMEKVLSATPQPSSNLPQLFWNERASLDAEGKNFIIEREIKTRGEKKKNMVVSLFKKRGMEDVEVKPVEGTKKRFVVVGKLPVEKLEQNDKVVEKLVKKAKEKIEEVKSQETISDIPFSESFKALEVLKLSDEEKKKIFNFLKNNMEAYGNNWTEKINLDDLSKLFGEAELSPQDFIDFFNKPPKIALFKDGELKGGIITLAVSPPFPRVPKPHFEMDVGGKKVSFYEALIVSEDFEKPFYMSSGMLKWIAEILRKKGRIDNLWFELINLFDIISP